jgi:hypothetical protein
LLAEVVVVQTGLAVELAVLEIFLIFLLMVILL